MFAIVMRQLSAARAHGIRFVGTFNTLEEAEGLIIKTNNELDLTTESEPFQPYSWDDNRRYVFQAFPAEGGKEPIKVWFGFESQEARDRQLTTRKPGMWGS